MAAWYALAATYLPDIIKLTLPLFTRTRTQEKTPEVMAQQIAELQSAALQNADSIKLMATEMQKTIETLQIGAAQLERRLQRAQMLAVAAAIIAALAFGVAAYALGG
jgi:uncharacterized phage infection (PIP) family protein YhgE